MLQVSSPSSLAFAATPFESRALSGPFEGLAQVEGAFPEWLTGRLIRTAPALFEENGWVARHWFDALGMLYSFDVEGPTRVSWMQRLLECDVTRAAQKTGRVPFATFGSGNDRSFFRRVFEPIPQMTDNTNVHVVPMGDEWVAMTEGPKHLRIDPATLSSRGPVIFEDDLPRAMGSTAHPLFDRAKNLVVNVGSVFGARPELVVFAHLRGGSRRQVVGRIPLPRLPYVHSFGLSATKVVIVAHPFDVHPMALLWSNDFIERFRWRPEQGTRVYVMDRATGATSVFETDPFFAFHMVNAFDDDNGDAVLDLMTYADPSVATEQTRVDSMLRQFPDIRAHLTRLRMHPGKTRVTSERLTDRTFELPAISYAAKSGRRHRYVFGAEIAPTKDQGIGSQIVRIDVEGGGSRSFSSSGYVFGEPVFVAPKNATREDDGVILSVGSDPQKQMAKLVALDAQDLRPLAEASIAVPLPFGFHGSFQRT